MARVPTNLLWSIVPVGNNQIDEGLEGLNDPAKSIGNLAGGPIEMRDCSGELFYLKSLRKMIARTILKAKKHNYLKAKITVEK